VTWLPSGPLRVNSGDAMLPALTSGTGVVARHTKRRTAATSRSMPPLAAKPSGDEGSETPNGNGTLRIRSRAEADRRRLRLLGLPLERRRHIRTRGAPAGGQVTSISLMSASRSPLVVRQGCLSSTRPSVGPAHRPRGFFTPTSSASAPHQGDTFIGALYRDC
jgi:hypothetical protein